MKRSVYLPLIACLVCLFLLCLIAVAHAQISPENPDALGDKEKIENLTGNIPINEQGEIDKGKFTVWKTQAELRIEKINLWLETNASWLKAAFGMTPEISWLFAINLYIWLFCLVYLFINGTIFGVFIENKNYARILGGVVFVVLIAFKIIYKFAVILLDIFDIIWNKILPLGIIAAVIAMIIIVVIFIVIAIYFPQVLVYVDKWLEERKHKKKIKEGEQAAGRIKATAKGIEEGRKIVSSDDNERTTKDEF